MCRICSRQVSIINLATHSNLCIEQKSIEESLMKIKNDLMKELPEISKLKNKIKFESMVFANQKKKDDLNSSQISERASVGGRHQVSFKPHDFGKSKAAGAFRRSGTITLTDEDKFENNHTPHGLGSPTRTVFEGYTKNNFMAIQEYPDEEQTPSRAPQRRNSKEMEQQFKEAFDSMRHKSRSPVDTGGITDNISPRGKDIEVILKEELIQQAEVASIIPNNRYDCNDSMIEEFSNIGIKNKKMSRTNTKNVPSAGEGFALQLHKSKESLDHGREEPQLLSKKDVNTSLHELRGNNHDLKRAMSGYVNILVEPLDNSLSDIGSPMERSRREIPRKMKFT